MLIAEKNVDTTDKKIAVVDRTGQIADIIVEAANERNANDIHDKETGKKIKPAYLVTVIEPLQEARAQRLELSDRVRAKQLAGFVEIDS